jgi:hypothetical protein
MSMALVAAALALGSSVATAQTLPPVPAGDSDGVLTFAPNGAPNITTVAEPADPAEQDGILNTGISTNAPDGFGVKLYDFDLPGTEKGSPVPVDSDYIYAFAGFIYFDSDSENLIPTPTHPINPANLIPLAENGQWQKLDQYWTNAGFSVSTPFWVFSNTVPEPAAWSLMLAGVGLTGAALRRRRATEAAVA